MSQDFNYSQMVFYNMAFHENQAWFCHCYYNALCRLDLETKEISIEAFFPTGNDIFTRYGDIVYCEEKLILVPRNTTIILIYDLKNRAFTEIELSNDYININEIYNLFTSAMLYENNVFFFPGRYHAIVKLNLKTLKLTYYTKWYEVLKPYIVDVKKVMFLEHAIFKEKVLLPFCQGDNIVKFSLKNGEFEIFEIGNKDLQISSIVYDGGNCWLGNKNKNSIYQWNIESNELLRFDDFPETFKSECAGVHKIVKYKNQIYIFPIFGNMVTKLNLENMKMEPFLELKTDCDPQLESFQIAKNNFLNFSFYDNKLYMYSIQDGMIYCIDLETQTLEKIKSVVKNVPKDIKNKLAETLFMTQNSQKILGEWDNLKLNMFLEIVINRPLTTTQINETKNVGSAIYNIVKKF